MQTLTVVPPPQPARPAPASMPASPLPSGLQSPPVAIVHPGRASWFVRRVVA
jgi:hypothetical protein